MIDNKFLAPKIFIISYKKRAERLNSISLLLTTINLSWSAMKFHILFVLIISTLVGTLMVSKRPQNYIFYLLFYTFLIYLFFSIFSYLFTLFNSSRRLAPRVEHRQVAHHQMANDQTDHHRMASDQMDHHQAVCI